MLVFSLDNESGIPLYQQIYEYIKEEIMQGRLSYREKLPSARELAASLLVSRNPVDTAYEQLVAEGYVYAVAQKGYYVNEITYIREYSGRKEDSPAPEEEKYRFAGNIILIRMKWTAVISLMRYFVLSPEM